jgi:Uma2 family endonuclease
MAPVLTGNAPAFQGVLMPIAASSRKPTRRKRAREWTLVDLAETFGPIPAWRIRNKPAPGTATEKDVLAIHTKENRLCELVDGILLEKSMGYGESEIAGIIITLLNNFVRPRRLGIVAGEGGMLRLSKGLVRIPDVSFVSRRRLPGGKRPSEPIPNLAPNLAVEVLSEGNTVPEMNRKLTDYFRTGVELVWYVDPRARTVEVFLSQDDSTVLKEGDSITGGTVLPGFKAKVREFFSDLD